MKSITHISILFLITGFISCSKKNESNPAQQDYRARYLGDYYCTGKYSYWNSIPSISYHSDTSMTIHVYEDTDNDSNILICSSTLIRDTTFVKLFVDKRFSGGFVAPYYIIVDGNFIYDSIYFQATDGMGLGMNRSFTMSGKKQ